MFTPKDIYDMAKVERKGNSVHVRMDDDTLLVFPMGTLTVVADDNSDMINFKLLASRKIVAQIDYQEIEGITASSPKDALFQLTAVIS